MGRLTEVKDARGNRTDYEYTYYGVEKIRNNRGHSMVYDYDLKGNLLSVRDTMINKELKYIYDKWDNLQRVVDPLGNSTEYEYNANEQVTAVRDSKGNKISYRYNAYNTVEEIKYTNPVGFNYTYEYDKYGRLLNEYDQSGNEISYQYYEDGSIKEAIDSMGNHTEYFYENGRIVKSERNGVITEYNYDSEGRIDYLRQSGERIEYEYNNLDQISAVIDSQGRKIEYTYNEVGNIKTMTVPGEGRFAYTYNDLNQVKTITTPADEVYTYTYDKAGRRTGLIYPNGKEISYSYDEYGRLKRYNNGIETVSYTYDKMNITGIETEEGKISYIYDKLDRLTGVSYPDGEVIKYSYDNAGNRTSKTTISSEGEEELISYTYDFSNRMIRAGNVRYEYDSKDRMVKKIDGEDTFVYSYNDLDQLISVTKNGIEVAGFSYDLAGRRITETINGETKEYLWSGDSLLAEYSGNTLDRLYAVGNGVDEVLGIYDEGGTQYLHSNHVGSITGVTDESGNIKGRKDYTPFGVIRDKSGNVDTNLAFIGREHYEELGLTYIRARFYEPSSGRFITKDPVRDGFNWYSYCGGNPVGYVDWSGMYDRETAKRYAEKWAKSRNPDYDIRRLPIFRNVSVPKWTWSDCTNYASQVLHAGGVEMRDNWYFNKGEYNLKGSASSYAISWTESTAFAEWLRSEESIVDSEIVLLKGSNKSDISKIIDQIAIGDLVGFAGDSKWENNVLKAKNIHHFAVITKIESNMIYYSGHTNDRLNESIITALVENLIIFHINPDAK